MKIPVGKTDDFFVVGFDDNGAPGIGLQSGQTCAVTSADPATVTITQDATPRVTGEDLVAANGVKVAAGAATIASGKAGSPATPAQLKVALSLTYTLAD